MKSIVKQTFIYLTTGITIIFLVLFFLANNKLEKLPAHTRNQYSQIVKARSDEVGRELKGTLEQIKILANLPIVKSLDFEQIKNNLADLLLEDKFRNYTVADIDGNSITTFGDEFNISDQEHYKKIIIENQDSIISQPYNSPFIYEDKDNFVIVVAHKVVDERNKTIGLVNGVIQIDFLNSIVRDIDLYSNGYGWIINRDGQMVAHPDYDIPISKSINDVISKDTKDIDRIFGASSGVINYLDKNNKKTLAFFSEIKDSPGWIFLVSVPVASIDSYVNDIRMAIIFALLLGLIAVTMYSIIYSNSIIRPILDLKDVFEKAADGQLNVRANEDVNNELGLAGKSFNMMLGQIKELTYIDTITHLYNYNGFLLELPYIIRKLREEDTVQAIVIISIDEFKRINSIYGHSMGDKVLEKFAGRLLDFIVIEDELVARYLSDEFILLLKANNKSNIEKRVKGLWRACSREIKIEDIEFVLKTTIGANVLFEYTDNIDNIINRASISKLVAKKSGGNKYKFYNHGLNHRIFEEQKIEEALNHAIKNNELRLAYQPIVDIETKKLIGTEALLRWTHPQYGEISPVTIISIAEQKGMIYEIGQWVLKEACRQNKVWQNRFNLPIIISVNVSVLEFAQVDFVDKIRIVLEETGMSPEYLELEITETVAMSDVEDKISKMKTLKDMGVRISIDDFGTGYSSLAYFTRFPIDTLKIDKSFVQNMINDHISRNIVMTIINMAKTLSLKIIAEGVETEEQFDLLKQMNCDKIQGYLICKPVEAEKIGEMIPGL